MRQLQAVRWPELTERVPLLIVPVGSTEQHGPHLPLSTDTDIAAALARNLLARCPGAVLAPALAYGASGEHADFPGTLSIGKAALELVLVELCRSAGLTARRVLLLNAHGGNSEALARALARLQAEGRDVRSWSPRWPGDAHAGRIETSVQLALEPARVRLDLARPGTTTSLVELLPRLRAEGVRAVSADGVLGDPTGSSAEEGERLLELAAEDLAAMVERWLER